MLFIKLNFSTCRLGSTHKVQVNPGRSLFDWAMKPFALRRLGHHIVSINGYTSNEVEINIGVRQGSVLGPLLFLIYINDLNIALKYSTVRHFADDTILLIKNKSLKQIKKHLNLDLRHLCKWLQANKISLDSSKTEMLVSTS